MKKLTEHLSKNSERFKSTKTMLNSVIMRSLLERDFAATEICHFFNHDYTEFSCKFINVNIDNDEEFTVEFDEDDKVKLKEKFSGIP